MVYDRERMQREDAVYAEHKRAVAAGEKRVLRRTSTGEFHSYPAAFLLARDECRATQLRKRRGAPKPGTSGRVDIDLLELGQEGHDQPGTAR